VDKNFGQQSGELMQGARNAVGTCLAVQPTEHVALIADAASSDVAASIAAALEEGGCPWEGILLEDVAKRPVLDLPEAIRQALETCDVGILCV
jgi:aminopeptidase